MTTEIYINYKYAGEVEDPTEFVDNIISERRKGNISKEVNIYYEEEINRVYKQNDHQCCDEPARWHSFC